MDDKEFSMKKVLMLAMVLLCSALVRASDSTVTGTWTMNVEGSPHGNAVMELVLKQDGTKVTGTFSTGHSHDMEVTGEFKDGELKIETTEGGDSRIIFSAKLKADGTLAGYVSSAMGDMKWTASRVVEKKDGR
jgi:hypothetical protein